MTREREDAVRRWDELMRLERTSDHWWWRPGWRVGRGFYTWHVTFDDAPEVQELAAYYQARLTLPFLDPVPADGLHMTLQGVGFTDEVGVDELGAITTEARRRCSALTPFALLLGPADADREGVPLRVVPWKPVEVLRDALREAIGAVWGPERVPEPAAGFRPHVTLFYSNAEADALPLRERLRALRGTAPVETTIRTVSLIRLNRDDRTYRWVTEEAVSLGASARP